MKHLTELHVHTQGAPETTPATTLATAALNEVLTAIVATEGRWALDVGTCTSKSLNANYYGTQITDEARLGNEWQLDGVPSCYQIFDGSQGENWVACIYPNGQVLVMFAGGYGMTAYLADGHQW